MIKHSFFLIAPFLAAFLLAIPAQAQETPDTTRAERYFPLEIGNVWEYEGQDNLEGVRIDQRRAVTADTLVNGIRYFRYEQQRVDSTGAPIESARVAYARFDTLSAELQVVENQGGYGIPYDFPLDAPFGSDVEYECGEASVSGDYEQTVEIRDDAVVTSVKTIDTGSCDYVSTFAAGIGLVNYTALGGFLNLRYARVGGIEYGERFAVATEKPPAAGGAARIEVFPNPVQSAVDATVTLVLGEAGIVTMSVYDMLGRAVTVLHEGRLAEGTHTFAFSTDTLPSGVYTVRLVRGERVAAQRITVIR